MGAVESPGDGTKCATWLKSHASVLPDMDQHQSYGTKCRNILRIGKSLNDPRHSVP